MKMMKDYQLNSSLKKLSYIYYLQDMIDNFRAYGEWKIQLTMKMKFISIKDDGRVKQCTEKSLFDMIQMKLLDNFVTTLFVFEYVDGLLHYKCHKISLNCRGSYIDSPE